MSSTTLALPDVVGYVLKDANTSALDRIGEALSRAATPWPQPRSS